MGFGNQLIGSLLSNYTGGIIGSKPDGGIGVSLGGIGNAAMGQAMAPEQLPQQQHIETTPSPPVQDMTPVAQIGQAAQPQISPVDDIYSQGFMGGYGGY